MKAADNYFCCHLLFHIYLSNLHRKLCPVSLKYIFTSFVFFTLSSIYEPVSVCLPPEPDFSLLISLVLLSLGNLRYIFEVYSNFSGIFHVIVVQQRLKMLLFQFSSIVMLLGAVCSPDMLLETNNIIQYVFMSVKNCFGNSFGIKYLRNFECRQFVINVINGDPRMPRKLKLVQKNSSVTQQPGGQSVAQQPGGQCECWRLH